MRGKAQKQCVYKYIKGITPAYAGKSEWEEYEPDED